MTKIKDIYNFILNVLPVSSDGDLLVEVKDGKKIILVPSKKEGIVDKTAGTLNIKTSGIKFENQLRHQEEKRQKRELSR